MSKQTINIGTVANDNTGDNLRSAMDKANQNFTELYNLSGAGTVDYARLHNEFKGDLTITANAIDWASGVYAEVTLTGNTTFTFTNLEKGKTIVIRMTGAFVPSFPASCELANGGTYNGAKQNYILLTCVDSTTPRVLLTINTTA